MAVIFLAIKPGYHNNTLFATRWL